ncbi:uncharacterized protein LOC108471970 [Gossypium arboreum]|uniref:uncharacterized protein LOC108471970 n=1 Tax=Gossypium arboreum TaxID=29729 RepID=UPI000819348B|nr:uncharacterized protein LOC108471970 [Gossypium arboreum]
MREIIDNIKHDNKLRKQASEEAMVVEDLAETVGGYILNTHSRSDLEVDSNLDQLIAVLQNWNKVYGNIYTRKKDLVSELSRVQRILEVRRSSHLVSSEAKIRGEIDDLLNHEELLWFQKSRTAWLENDDRNTKYFHGRTMARRRANKVEGLKIDEGRWCFDDEVLKQHAVEFFPKIFTKQRHL